MIYHLIPSVFKLLYHHEESHMSPIVIVISPLKALIKDQIEAANKLKCLSLKATCLDIRYYNEISSGRYNILIDTPDSTGHLSKRVIFTRSSELARSSDK